MKNQLSVAALFLRFALGATFLSAVASRLGLWGAASSGWKNFVSYTAEVNSFAPVRVIPFLAVASTTFEIAFACLLIIGYKTRWAALGAGSLTLVFALAMTYSYGVKAPLDYSVFVFSGAAFLLSSNDHRWSLDEYLNRNS